MGKVIEFRHPQSTIDRNVRLILARGGNHCFLSLPFEAKGRGIASFADPDNEGWYRTMVTTKAFIKLKDECQLVERAYESSDFYGLLERIDERRKIMSMNRRRADGRTSNTATT